MTDCCADASVQRLAGLAGLLCLAIIICRIWREAAVRASLMVPGDAAATAGNIPASGGLFRMGVAADTVMLPRDVALAG